jgi:hypothetical protein
MDQRLLTASSVPHSVASHSLSVTTASSPVSLKLAAGGIYRVRVAGRDPTEIYVARVGSTQTVAEDITVPLTDAADPPEPVPYAVFTGDETVEFFASAGWYLGIAENGGAAKQVHVTLVHRMGAGDSVALGG